MQTFRTEFAAAAGPEPPSPVVARPKPSSSPFLAARPRFSPAESAVSEALAEGADEIRLEEGRMLKRFFRIDGIWHAKEPLQPASFREIREELARAARLRLESAASQDGSLRLGILGDRAAHLQIVPNAEGEVLTLRILDAAPRSLEAFGFQDEDLANVRTALRKPGGVFVVAGPSRSGKTALLHALADEIGAENTLVIERRPEADLPGTCQLRSLPADRLFRAATDDGVEVVTLDELNDEASATAVKGALAAGKKVLVGLPNGDTSRLERLSSSLRAVLRPRLFRTACDACARERTVSRRDAHLLGVPRQAADELFDGVPSSTFREGAKCAACRWTGFRGKTAATAVRFFPDSGSARSLDAAWAAVRNGRTSPAEAARILFPH